MALISSDSASAPERLEPASDSSNTTYLALADREGMAVSLIQTIFGDWGCGAIIVWNFSRQSKHRAGGVAEGELLLERRCAGSTAKALTRRGHRVTWGSEWDTRTGGVQAILIEPHSGALQAAADPRREGVALGH